MIYVNKSDYMNKRNIIISLIINIIIVIITLCALVMMYTGFRFMHGIDILSVSHIEMFKFYTVDSNLLMGLVSLLFLIDEIKLLKGKIKEISTFKYILKLTSTVGVTLTFLTVFLYLGNIVDGGVGTANNHVNKYVTSNTSASYYQKAYDYNSAGYLAFYSSETCGYDSNNNWVTTGCNNNYADSDIKYVVDAWALDKTTSSDLKEIDGYKARMITYDELTDELGYEKASSGTIMPSSNGDTPNWVWNSGNNAGYWTMSGVADSTDRAWYVFGNNGGLGINYDGRGPVRPVINLLKSAIN